MLLCLSAIAQRSRCVLACAALVIVAAAWFGWPVTQRLTSASQQFQAATSQYERTNVAIRRATGQSAYDGVVILLSDHAAQTTPTEVLKATTTYIMSRARRQPGFERIAHFVVASGRGVPPKDRDRAVLMAAYSSPRASVAAAARLSHLAHRVEGMRMLVGGPDVTFHELASRTRSDLRDVELFALPALLLMSLWIFRSLFAALLPLLLGGSAVLVAFLALRLLSPFVDLSIFALNVAAGLGLGLGLDYSLLMLTRYREESARSDVTTALRVTLETAGRTVIWSATIVAAALSSLLLFPVSFLYSMGIAGALTALAAGGIALTVLPAALLLLVRLGDTSVAGRQGAAMPGAFWGRLARAVIKRPGVIALATAILLIACATPALRLRFIAPSARLLPPSAPSLRVEGALVHDFTCNPAAAIPVVFAGHSGQGRSASASFALEAQRLVRDQCGGVLGSRYLRRGTWEVIVPSSGSPYTAINQRLVANVRKLATSRGGIVGGLTAYLLDQRSAIADHLFGVIVLLIGVTMIVLFFATGSLVIPVKAVVMNAITAAVAAGLLVLIFQDGVLAAVLGFRPVGGLEEANLIVLLVIAFALSTDYEVFLMSRMTEAHDRGAASLDAIASGLERTGRIVTAAACLFCVAVGAFAVGQLVAVKQFGIGAALTVAIDASVIRMLLVPSVMAFMGEWNWWAPGLLQRLRNRSRTASGGRVRDDSLC